MLRRLPLTGHLSRRAIARSLSTTPRVLDRHTGGPPDRSLRATTSPSTPSSGPSAYPDARWGDWNRTDTDKGKSKSWLRKSWLDVSDLDLSAGDLPDDIPLDLGRASADMEGELDELAWQPKGKKSSATRGDAGSGRAGRLMDARKDTGRTRSRDPEDEDGLAPPPRGPKAAPSTPHKPAIYLREPAPYVREKLPHLDHPRVADKPHLKEMAPWLKEVMDRKYPTETPASQPAPERSPSAPKTPKALFGLQVKTPARTPKKTPFGLRAPTAPPPAARQEPPRDEWAEFEREEQPKARPAKTKPPAAKKPFGLLANTPAQSAARASFGLRAPTAPPLAARQESVDEWTRKLVVDPFELDVPPRETKSRVPTEDMRPASPPPPAHAWTASQPSRLVPRSATKVVPAPMPAGPWKPEWHLLNPANMPPLARRDFLYEGADYKAVFEAAQSLGRPQARREYGADPRPTFGCPSFTMSAFPLRAVKRQGAPEQPSPFPAAMHRRQLSPAQRRVRVCVVASKNSVSTLAVERRHTRNKFKAAFDLVANRVCEGSGSAPLNPDYVYLVTIKTHLYNVDFVRLCSSVEAGLTFIAERIRGLPRGAAQGRTPRRDGPGAPHKAPPRPANRGNQGPRKPFGLRSDL